MVLALYIMSLFKSKHTFSRSKISSDIHSGVAEKGTLNFTFRDRFASQYDGRLLQQKKNASLVQKSLLSGVFT